MWQLFGCHFVFNSVDSRTAGGHSLASTCGPFSRQIANDSLSPDERMGKESRATSDAEAGSERQGSQLKQSQEGRLRTSCQPQACSHQGYSSSQSSAVCVGLRLGMDLQSDCSASSVMFSKIMLQILWTWLAPIAVLYRRCTLLEGCLMLADSCAYGIMRSMLTTRCTPS